MSEEHARKTVTMEPHPHGGAGVQARGFGAEHAYCRLALVCAALLPCMLRSCWSELMGSVQSDSKASPALQHGASLCSFISLHTALQAASIHPCQHANVMHKLSERVAGESGEGFQLDR